MQLVVRETDVWTSEGRGDCTVMGVIRQNPPRILLQDATGRTGRFSVTGKAFAEAFTAVTTGITAFDDIPDGHPRLFQFPDIVREGQDPIEIKFMVAP